jgi:hypothetical protein
MFLNIHFLHSHMDCFPENLATVSDEKGERFSRENATMAKEHGALQ